MCKDVYMYVCVCVCLLIVFLLLDLLEKEWTLPRRLAVLWLTAHDNEMYDNSDYEDDCSMILLMIMKMNDKHKYALF